MYITHYDPNPVPITYTDEELEAIVDNYIKGEESFSFQGLSNFIVFKAKQENKVKGAPDTVYTSNELNPSFYRVLSKILWKHIWGKELFIEFGENQHRSNYTGDTHFVKVNNDSLSK